MDQAPKIAPSFSLIVIALTVATLFGSKKMIKNKFVNEPKTYYFSEERLRMESESTQQTIGWNDLTKYILTKEAAYLFMSNRAVHVIPLLSATAENKESIDRLIQTNVRLRKTAWSAIMPIFLFIFIFLVVVGLLQSLSSGQ